MIRLMREVDVTILYRAVSSKSVASLYTSGFSSEHAMHKAQGVVINLSNQDV